MTHQRKYISPLIPAEHFTKYVDLHPAIITIHGDLALRDTWQHISIQDVDKWYNS